jgi:16S rRNA (guanine966-N2)-methyltransferase
VLDGYAGTGALGIEALSRGAAHVTFVERDRRAQTLIAENLAHCGIGDRYVIIRASIDRALAESPPSAFDIVFLDPPYDQPAGVTTAVIAAAGERLVGGGVVVFEHAKRQPAPDAAGRLSRSRLVPSGDSVLSFYD